MGGWKKDSSCYWKMEVWVDVSEMLDQLWKNQDQYLRKLFTLRNNRRKVILSKLLKFSTWIFIIQIQLLDHYLSSYRLGEWAQWKTSNGGWISANEFSKPYLFQDRVSGSVLLLVLLTVFKWCFKMLYTSLHKKMIAKIPRHAPFPSDFHWNHLERVQRL